MTNPAGGAKPTDVAALFHELTQLPEHSPRREEIRDRLVREHLELARNLARKFRNRDEAMDDLVQIATVGLIHAVDRYDPTQGTDFLAFAVPTISGELRHHFRDNSWSVRVPRRLKELNATISAAREELTVRLSRAPKPSEIARHLGVPVEDVYEGLRAGQAATARRWTTCWRTPRTRASARRTRTSARPNCGRRCGRCSTASRSANARSWRCVSGPG